MSEVHRRLKLAILAALPLLSSSCLPRNQSVDLLHARLRSNEEQLAELQTSLNSSQSHLKQARREIDSLRTQIAESGHSQLTPEQTTALVQITKIDVQPWLTGGIDQDEAPGDDALVVHFSPQDEQGEAVKLPGLVTITLTDPGEESGNQVVGEWSFTPEQCREHWTRGWLGGGYQFTLPWEHSPNNSRLVVHVAYGTPDGRSFDDTELVKVNPSPEALAKRTKSGRKFTPQELKMDEENLTNVTPANNSRTAQKPKPFPEAAAAEGTTEDESPPPSSQGERKLKTPTSVNWTDDTIPRLR